MERQDIMRANPAYHRSHVDHPPPGIRRRPPYPRPPQPMPPLARASLRHRDYAFRYRSGGDRRSGKRHGDGLFACQATGQRARGRLPGTMPFWPIEAMRPLLPFSAPCQGTRPCSSTPCQRRRTSLRSPSGCWLRSIRRPTATDCGWNGCGSTKRPTAGPTPPGPTCLIGGRIRPRHRRGGVAERLNAPVLKTGNVARRS